MRSDPRLYGDLDLNGWEFLLRLTDRFSTDQLAGFFSGLLVVLLVLAFTSPWHMKPLVSHRHYHEHNYEPDDPAPSSEAMETRADLAEDKAEQQLRAPAAPAPARPDTARILEA